MTPRDHYAAAALQSLVRGGRCYDDEDIANLARVAAEFADAMAAEACKRWGHINDDGVDCKRCGLVFGGAP